LSQYQEHTQIFLLLFFDLNEFLVKFLFNIQQFFHYKSKHKQTILVRPLLIEGFPIVLKVQQEAPYIGRSQHDKQNKQANKLFSFMGV
jgi:hypothetical protein